MTNTRKLFSIFLSSTLILFRVFAFTVNAEEFVITGNGDGSSNEVAVQASNTTSIEQTNNGNVDNNVDTASDTGGNEASDNNGNATIATGDIDSKVVVSNSLNSSQVSSACCPMGSEVNVEISNNGSDSDNKVDFGINHEIQVDVNQNANIDNRVSGSANTGDNKANDNNGNVSINTGNIFVKSGIKNGPVNTYEVDPANQTQDIFASISGNGSGSNNLITSLFSDIAKINTNNNANIQNHLVWDLNTGNNEANGNNGNVSIKTGDIFADLFINNDPINSGKVDISCCKPGNPEPPVNPPSVNPPGSNNPGPSVSEVFGMGNGAGPAVLGLSFTGGLFDNPLIFWTGLLMLTIGTTILGRNRASVSDPPEK